MIQEPIVLELYVVRNSEGKFFRSKGYMGSGQTWVDISKARTYANPRGARGVITYFASEYPKFPVPELVKLTITSAEVMDETERIKKSLDKKAKKEAEYQQWRRESELAEAQRKLREAEQTLKRLQK